MTDVAMLDAYGVLEEPTTLRIQRLLPGPIERVWAYLTESDLRRQWLAAGAMELRVGAEFELVWRNGELTDPPGARPEGIKEEHRLQSRITECDPPRLLAFTWGSTGGVQMELAPAGERVLLTVTHHRIAERPMRLMVSAGWHAHLDTLATRIAGGTPAQPFWEHWSRLRDEYKTSGFRREGAIAMRKLIAGMKLSLDGRMEGPDGSADWVDAWSDDNGMMQQVDACLLGGGMYPGYENYWTGIMKDPATPAWITGTPPTPAELEYARFIPRTPHYVLSGTMESAAWPNARILRGGVNDVLALKRQAGKDIYLVGGGRLIVGLFDAGLVDELRLIVYPLIAGEGRSLFETAQRRHRLELLRTETLAGGRVRLIYSVG